MQLISLQVRARTGAGYGNYSSHQSTVTQEDYPDAPTSLAVTFGNSDGFYWTQDITPTSSFIWASSQATGSEFDGGFSGSALTSVGVYAISASIDVEYVLVNA